MPQGIRRKFRTCLAIALLFASSVVAAQGSLRALPAEAKKGEMRPPEATKVRIDGKTYPLSPGLRLRDQNNMIIFPGAVKEAVTVRYTVDTMGMIDRVWILTPAEKAAAAGKP